MTIALVGKYVRDSSGKVMEDAYASVGKALRHAALYVGRKLRIEVFLAFKIRFFHGFAVQKLLNE